MSVRRSLKECVLVPYGMNVRGYNFFIIQRTRFSEWDNPNLDNSTSCRGQFDFLSVLNFKSFKLHGRSTARLKEYLRIQT